MFIQCRVSVIQKKKKKKMDFNFLYTFEDYDLYLSIVGQTRIFPQYLGNRFGAIVYLHYISSFTHSFCSNVY